jgi:predicted O-methyltransferase YrrM
MIKKIIQKVKFHLLRQKVGSFDQLKKIKPFDQINPDILEQNKEKLRPYYEQYVTEVSRADMAASLELSAFIFTLCQVNCYSKLLDMGSGLSSFVFRLFIKENPGAVVFSVDDDSAWLEKTRDYLRLHKLSTENTFTLDQFLRSKESEFDCIFYDLNFVEVRINYVEQIMQIAKSKGVIIIDDVHKPDYLFAFLTKLKGRSLRAYDLKPITIDPYKRHALAVVMD